MSFNDITDNEVPNRLIRTKAGEFFDGKLYFLVHEYITSYVREDSELKFFYQMDGKKAYLLYKLVSTPESPTPEI
jgi:hypothetical protein